MDFAAVVVSGADKALSSPKRIFFVSREKARIRFKKGTKRSAKIWTQRRTKSRKKNEVRRDRPGRSGRVGRAETSRRDREEERDTGRRDEVVDALFTLDPANSMSSSEDEEDDEEEDGAHLMIGNVRVDVERGKEKRAKKKGESHSLGLR